MQSDVKTFIEENIRLIEEEKWELLYLRWYDQAYGGVEQDQYRIDELNDALWEAQITTLQQTGDARKAAMTSVLEEIFDRVAWDMEHGYWSGSYNYVSVPYIFEKELQSDLGLDKSVIKQLIEDVAKSKDFVKYRNEEAYYLKRLNI